MLNSCFNIANRWWIDTFQKAMKNISDAKKIRCGGLRYMLGKLGGDMEKEWYKKEEFHLYS